MKFHYYILFVLLALPFFVLAQNPIPNPGFENWTGGNPDGWVANNIPGFTPVTQSSNSHSGSFALRGEVLNVAGSPFPPSIISGDQNNIGFPVSQRHARLTGFYQFAPVASDQMFIVVTMFKDQQGIGAGVATVLNPASSYNQITVPIQYATGEAPDSCIISISAADSTGGNPGTVFLVDDLQFEGIVGIEDEGESGVPQKFALEQNFPNPFNPSTTFKFSLPRGANVRLEVFNPLGQRVATVLNEKMSIGTHEVEWQAKDLPSGIYFYRLTANSPSGQKFVETRKLVLMK